MVLLQLRSYLWFTIQFSRFITFGRLAVCFPLPRTCINISSDFYNVNIFLKAFVRLNGSGNRDRTCDLSGMNRTL